MRSWHRLIDSVGGLVGPILGLVLIVVSASVPGTRAAPARSESGFPDPARSASGFSVEIEAAPFIAEPGLPVLFRTSLHGGTPPFAYQWSDSEGRSGSSANYSSFATTVVNLSATVEVVDATGAFAAASDTETVVAGIELGLTAENATDAGVPFNVSLSVSGGVDPYRLTLIGPDGATTNDTLPAPGAFRFPVPDPGPGWYTMTANVTDAVGGVRATRIPVANLTDRPSLSVEIAPDAVELGVAYQWWLAVSGGTPPISWSSECVGADSNASVPNGSVPSPGTIRWPVAFEQRGNATVLFSARDAAGATAQLRVPLVVAPPLEALLSAPGDGPGVPPAVNVSIDGGVPPYEFLLTATDSETRLGNATGEISFAWTLDARASGALNVSLRVRDRAGGDVSVTIAAPWRDRPATPPAPDPGPATVTIGIATVAVVGVAATLAILTYRRRTSRAPAMPGPIVPATAEVERILEESDAMERETLYLLGEDRGLSRESVEAGISEGLRTGRIESVRGAGGEALLRWRDEPSPPRSEGP